MSTTSTRFILAAFLCLMLIDASAQPSGDPGDSNTSSQSSTGAGGSSFGGGAGGGHRGHRSRRDSAQPAASDKPAPLKVTPDPVQRLEQGALLCDTVGELQQHQAAVAARLSGGFAPEPSGCRILSGMTAVALVERHGLPGLRCAFPTLPRIRAGPTLWCVTRRASSGDTGQPGGEERPPIV